MEIGYRLPSGHMDVLRTSYDGLFGTLGRPYRTSQGRLRDMPNETTFVRPNKTSRDVPKGHLMDLISVKEDHEWTGMNTNGLKEDHKWTCMDLSGRLWT